MKNQRNAILVGVESRVRQLLERYEESKAIRHAATIGSLREAYLQQFLVDFIPHPFGFKSGFVTDCRGHVISPQIDLLVFDKTSIPCFALSEFHTIVPLEAVRLGIEVKSNLKSSDFTQIKKQQESIRQMRFAWPTRDRKYLRTVDCLGMPQILCAFESKCSKTTLAKWFDHEQTLHAICIVGRYLMFRDPNTDKIETVQSDVAHAEVLHLVSMIYSTILASHHDQRQHSRVQTPEGELSFGPDFGTYLTFDVPYPGPGSDSDG